MKFILLTEQRGCGERFPYYIDLEAKTWPKARQEVKKLLADEDYWDSLSIGMPAKAEIIEIANREQVTF